MICGRRKIVIWRNFIHLNVLYVIKVKFQNRLFYPVDIVNVVKHALNKCESAIEDLDDIISRHCRKRVLDPDMIFTVPLADRMEFYVIFFLVRKT